MKEIGDYIYHNDFIGKGSFSKVYIGYKKNNKGKKYAIKKIYKKPDSKYIYYIEKEIEIMNKLDHKNIIKLYETINTDKYIFLILELCDCDLHSFMNKNDLNEDEIKFIIRQITDALKYIMDNNIVHRDLKPHNILINKDLTIKLCDFGFAKEFKDTLMSNTVCGSPLYMAPEILQNHTYNLKSDIWSLGIIMYEMFMKDHPYKANNINDLISKLNNNKPIMVNTNIDEKCKDLIYNLLIIDYKKRLDWDDIFTNEWIYDNVDKINKIVDIKSDNKDITIDKEYSFDDCFNSIDYVNEKETVIEYDNDYFKKEKVENNKINVIDDYIIVDKPDKSKMNKFIKNVKNIFSTI